MDKPDIRAEVRRRLSELDDVYRKRALDRLIPEVDGLVIGPSVMLYCGFRREVSVDRVIESTIYHHGWCALPRVTEAGLVAHEVRDLETDLAISDFGIREPRADLPVVDPARLDTIIVPGRAFSPSCGRVGWGKGHYDRFLTRTRAGVRLVGVCWQAQIFEDLPLEAHDRQMTLVVTENRIFWA